MDRTTSIISSSVPSPFRALTAWMTNRQLDCTYPSDGSMRSILGVRGRGPWPLCPVTNDNPDTAHAPVQADTAHSSVKSNGTDFFSARFSAYRSNMYQGRSFLVFKRYSSLRLYHASGSFAYLSRMYARRFSRCFAYEARECARYFSGFARRYLSFFDFHRHCFEQYRDRLCAGMNSVPQTAQSLAGKLAAFGIGVITSMSRHHNTMLVA
jgi:hypothetical protein